MTWKLDTDFIKTCEENVELVFNSMKDSLLPLEMPFKLNKFKDWDDHSEEWYDDVILNPGDVLAQNGSVKHKVEPIDVIKRLTIAGHGTVEDVIC